ncbi:hypothetical protein H0910_10180 [Providencia alcalifaciens]|uniref:hypothetical protein n=1 Tax=Providencia alcalifaciens TaxID=126385 RepID=UPI0015EB9890|nr:hypothetical protein H0910_10180 [Providencia alcalifaciens]
MSDKKEVTELCIKVSVDTTGLDKLEAQLKRIAGLMVDAGIKVSNHVGFSAQQFVFGQECILAKDCFINDVVLTGAIENHQLQEDLNRTVDIIKDQDKAIADAVRKVAQKAAIDALRNNAKVV